VAPYAVDVSLRLAEPLKLRIQIEQSALANIMELRGNLPLAIAGAHLPHVDPSTHDDLVELAEDLYELELFKTVRTQTRRRGTLGAAISAFRLRYKITEKDEPFTRTRERYQELLGANNVPLAGLRRVKAIINGTRIAQSTRPAGAVLFELHTDRGMQRYLARNLNPLTAHTTPYALKISEQMAQLLNLSLQLVVPPTGADASALHLAVRAIPDGGGSLNLHARLNYRARTFFIHEMGHTADRLHHGMGLSKKTSISFFRSEYGITDEEADLHSSEKNYQRYQLRKGRYLKRGRPRRSGRN
jgi:hypothetical protein